MQEQKQLTTKQKIKKSIWKGVYPFFHSPLVQKYILRMHWGWYTKGRQQYHLGWIAPGKTIRDLHEHVASNWGFGNHFVAWIDRGQVASWRKLESFDFQYHIRVFEDGEIRGHYEYTPESKPFKHLFEFGEQTRTDDFKKFLGEYAVYEEYLSIVSSDINTSPETQVEIDTMSTLTLHSSTPDK